MKKILYSLAILLGLSLAGCSEADNLAGDGDTLPAVTIYSYDIPAGADPDATVNLRFIPNLVCDKFYVLIEKKADKDAFIATNGESAYADRVVAQGTQYPVAPKDYLDETLAGAYAITAVGVSGSGEKGAPVEFVFNGIEWSLVGTAYYYEDASFTATAIDGIPANWYVSTNLETTRYKLEDYYGDLGAHGYTMKLSWDDTGALTFYSGQASPTANMWLLPTPYTNATYGAMYADVDLDPDYTYYDEGVVYINFRRRVDAGTFAGWYYMYIELP